jgi:adenine-specific DNA-methyltransferase
MGNIMLPLICGIKADRKSELLNQIDEIVRNDRNIEFALDLVDKEILIKLLGLNELICQRFRNIWKKLQQRRLRRS